MRKFLVLHIRQVVRVFSMRNTRKWKGVSLYVKQTIRMVECSLKLRRFEEGGIESMTFVRIIDIGIRHLFSVVEGYTNALWQSICSMHDDNQQSVCTYIQISIPDMLRNCNGSDGLHFGYRNTSRLLPSTQNNVPCKAFEIGWDTSDVHAYIAHAVLSKIHS